MPKDVTEELETAIAAYRESSEDRALRLGLSPASAASCEMHHYLYLHFLKQRNPKADLEKEFRDIRHLKISEIKLLMGDFMKVPSPEIFPGSAAAVAESGEKKR